MTESRDRSGKEFAYEHPLEQVAKAMLDMPAFENPDDRPEFRPNGSRTIAEAYNAEGLTGDFDNIFLSEGLQTPESVLIETGRILLHYPGPLAIIAAYRPEYLKKISLTEPEVRASLWEHLEMRLRSEKALQAQKIFGIEFHEWTSEAHKFVPKGKTQQANARIRQLSAVQGMLVQAKRK